jgi:NAD dependent epimerase/dehydratase
MRSDKGKALVTGADGFIGSHLVETLVREGRKVRAFVQYNSFNSWGWLDDSPLEVRNAIEVVAGDVRDPFVVHEAMQGVESVFHLAALIGIPYSYVAPQNYVETNITGTLNVLQAARTLGNARVLVTSTSEVYGTALSVPIDETHPRQPQSPYSATKIAADCLAESFVRSFGLPVTIVRPFNTFGPRQSARAIIPTIIAQALSGREEVSLGALHPTRDLVFVRDTVEGFLRIEDCDSLIGEDVNIATESEIGMSDLAERILEIVEVKARIVSKGERLRPGKSEVERLLGSAKKLAQHTKWKPSTTLDDGLRATIEWFRNPANLSKYKSDRYNV